MLITLAYFALIGYVVRAAAGPRLAIVLTAVAALMAPLAAVLHALHGS